MMSLFKISMKNNYLHIVNVKIKRYLTLKSMKSLN